MAEKFMERNTKKFLDAELIAMRQEVEKAIAWANLTGKVDLILPKFYGNSARLRIIKNRWGYHVHFAQVVTRNSITIPEIDQPDLPWEMPIDAPTVNLDQIARHLPSFIHDFYPQVKGLPINIYQSRTHYLSDNPAIARIGFVGNLVTLNTDLP